MSDNNSSKRAASVRAARLRTQTFVRLGGLIAFVVLAAIYGGNGTASASEAVPPAETVSTASTAVPAEMVVVVLPETTGDATAAELLVEVYALRLQRRGFIGLVGDRCECLYGAAATAVEVRNEIEMDYPGLWDDTFFQL